MSTDAGIYQGLGAALAILGCTLGGTVLVRTLSRSRPSLGLGAPLATGFVLRILAAAGVSLLSTGGSLRGGDEPFLVQQAQTLSHLPLSSAAWTDEASNKLYEVVFALQIKLFDAPDLALRTTQIAISLVGLALITAAVYDLAGWRAARWAAWIGAFEPANVFFSSLEHKEALLFLAEGLIAFAGVRLWKTGRLEWVLAMALGCLIALATRVYAGWFLGAAACLLILHAAVRGRRPRGVAPLALLALLGVGAVALGPRVSTIASQENLLRLQLSQNANTHDTSNLKLEPVDFSTPGAVVTHLPQRMFDVLAKPFPWQLSNTSQQLGALGTLVLWALLAIFAWNAWLTRRLVLTRAGPLLYVGFCLLVAYSLSAGNAGTAFRYRTHVVGLLIGAAAIIRFAPRWTPGGRTAVPSDARGVLGQHSRLMPSSRVPSLS